MPVPSAEHPICTRIILAGCPPGDFAAWRLDRGHHLPYVNHNARTLGPRESRSPCRLPRNLGPVVLSGVGGAVFQRSLRALLP
jgi:hypothetical protein